jgi:hypothetical protein
MKQEQHKLNVTYFFITNKAYQLIDVLKMLIVALNAIALSITLHNSNTILCWN